MQIAQYPRNADNTPMALQVGVLTDSTGNNGARLAQPVLGPDGAPLDATALVLLGADGNPYNIARVTNPQQFGAKGDNINDDTTAFQNALEFLRLNANTGFGYGYRGTGKLFIPKGTYKITSTIDIYAGTIIEGESTGGVGPGSSVLNVVDCTCFRTQEYNTTGATGYNGVASATYGSGYALIRNLTLVGNVTSQSAVVEAEYHGIHIRNTCYVSEVGIYNFKGDGVHLYAVAGGGAGSEGNANACIFTNVFAQGCRNGFFFDGADVNICSVIACNAISNRQWGFWDSSFLGNSYFGCHTQGNGCVSPTPCAVTNAGNVFVVKKGQEAGASTNAPPGTATDNTWWYYLGPAGTISPAPAAWVNGTTYRAGGSYCTDDTGNAGILFSGCYIEGGQPYAQVVTPTLIVGGSMYPAVKGGAPLRGATNGARVTGDWIVDGGLYVSGNTTTIGPQSGVAADSVNYLYNTNVSSMFFAVSATNGNIGWMDFRFGIGIRYNVANANWNHVFQVNGTEVCHIGSGGLSFTEIAAASVPNAPGGMQTLFIDSADHKLKRKDSAGTVTIIG